MHPQFFPWLFDDKNAWEKSLADPRYSYELPIDSFMSLYQIERKVSGGVAYAMPILSQPVMSLPVAAPPMQSYAAAPFADIASAMVTPKKEEKKEEGILSQDEIDALLSGS